MNYLRKILQSFLLFFLIFWVFQNANAGNVDGINWNNFIIYTDYNESNETLNIKLWVNVSGKTKSDYKIKFKIANDTCETGLIFSYGTYKVQWECDVKIKKEDMKGLFRVDATITDTDENTDENKEIRFEVKWFDDGLTWENLKTKAIYDNDREKLEITFFYDELKTEPGRDYTVELDFEGKKHDTKMKYSSSDKEIASTFKIYINDKKLKSSYKIRFKILSDNLNGDEKTIYKGTDKIKVTIPKTSDDFDWKDLDVSWIYDEKSKKLIITMKLEDISEKPIRKYTADIKIIDKDYDERFKWNKNDKELVATFKIRINPDELDNDYDVNIKITDDKKKRVLKDDYNVDADSEEEAKKKEEERKKNKETGADKKTVNIEIEAIYQKDRELLRISVTLKDISKKPTIDYIASLTWAGRSQDRKLLYNSSKKTLSYTFSSSIKEKHLLDEYPIYLKIEDKKKKLIYQTRETIQVWWKIISSKGDDKKEKTTKENNTTTKEKTTKEEKITTKEKEASSVKAWKIEKVINNFIKKVERNHPTLSERKRYLWYIVESLNEIKKRKPKYKNLIEKINVIIQERIDFYNDVLSELILDDF